MATRLTRPQQVERNRELVIDAAWQIFSEAGYAKATLEAIAERAGFSKGVVYSQFESKADLFLVLLERRIAARAERNQALAETMSPADALAALIDVPRQLDWQRALIEFRAQASRDDALNRRYAGLHARTIERLAGMLEILYTRAGAEPPVATTTLAEWVLAISTGITLERATEPEALPNDALILLLTRALGIDGRTT
jgi:AcrR family transcriptional regulator